MQSYQLTIPSNIYAGKSSIDNLVNIITKENVKSILVFTDKGVRVVGLCDKVEEICKTVQYRIIDDLTAEPAVADVERVINEVGSTKYDLIIGVGGGSVMDASKLASIILGADYSLRDLLKDSSIAKKQIKTVMIPTTCGTGSEATCNAIVAIPEQESKQGIVNNCMIPDYVILDVNMIAKLPPKIIAATGVDALAHVVECFTSKKATMLSDTYAKEGAYKIFHNIRKAYNNADDLEAKSEMMLGAFYGGVAITGSGTTAFAYVMEFNKDGCKDRLAMLCDAVYPELAVKSIDEKADYIIKEIADIVKDTNIPTSLEEFGVKPDDLDFLVQAGSQQTRLLVNNCKELSLDDIRYIYKKVM